MCCLCCRPLRGDAPAAGHTAGLETDREQHSVHASSVVHCLSVIAPSGPRPTSQAAMPARGLFCPCSPVDARDLAASEVGHQWPLLRRHRRQVLSTTPGCCSCRLGCRVCVPAEGCNGAGTSAWQEGGRAGLGARGTQVCVTAQELKVSLCGWLAKSRHELGKPSHLCAAAWGHECPHCRGCRRPNHRHLPVPPVR